MPQDAGENMPALAIEDFQPEAGLPPSELVESNEMTEAEFKKQKTRLAKEWSNFSGVEISSTVDLTGLSDVEFINILFDNLMQGVDLAIKEIGFVIDNDLKIALDKEESQQRKSELQKQFINSILQQTKGLAEGGKFNRGKEDKWAFYPQQIIKSKRLNCSGATLVIGRILENSGFQVEHGLAAHHAVSVVKLADGHSYYVDSRRNRHNIIALDDEVKQIGGFNYQELHHPQIAYEKIITIPSKQAEVEVVISNYNAMRNESRKSASQDLEAKRQIEDLDKKMDDIDFSVLWNKLFPASLELHTEVKEWLEEEKKVDSKHKFSDQVEASINETFVDLSQEQKIILTQELQSNGQKIYDFCSNLEFELVDLKNSISPDAYKIAVIIRDVLEGIRGQSQSAYEFAMAELKEKMLG